MIGISGPFASRTAPERYRAITRRTVDRLPRWRTLDPDLRRAVEVVAHVLPFRVNEYVVERLIDWDRVPDDPIFQLTFPQRGMLDDEDFARVARLADGKSGTGNGREGTGDDAFQEVIREIRADLNPHPAGQLTHNVPTLGGRPLAGMQHKYRETLLFFPARGQTCHAYCTYCFRWAQFVGAPELRFEARETADLVAYLRAHPEVTDVLVTGGDPLIMKTKLLREYLAPLLSEGLENLTTIRIGTKSPAYWPYRFLTDDDAEDLLRFFEEIVAAGRHLALMGHFSHPVEIRTPEARRALRRIRATGAEVRMQAPLIRKVNDDPAAWIELWREGVRLGLVPYYMFVERDTGAKRYFEVPLARGLEIFQATVRNLSGLARTVRGPSMSAHPGKVRVLGTARVRGEKVFVLDFLQARNPSWVGRPFFARWDPEATWLDELRPAFGEERFFFQIEDEAEPVGRSRFLPVLEGR
jgi:L-lysine 2,3-aminomutase